MFCTNILFLTFAIRNGGLAQLARALAWHARGHRFDSDILHGDNQGFTKHRKALFLSGNTWVTHKIV
jgi:hypothetical protein